MDLDLINQLLLNMLIIITPVMLYQVFWLDRMSRFNDMTNRWLVAVLCAVVSLFCMLHPFELYPGFQYDFRTIPLIVCFFYSGTVPAVLAGAILCAYRLYVGGLGGYVLPVSLVILLLILWLFKKWVVHDRRPYSLRIAAMLGLLTSINVVCVSFFYRQAMDYPLTMESVKFFSIFCVLHSVTLTLVAYIIRQIRHNLELRNQLQHKEKINVLGELAASFAHEIRTPMTVARGFIQMIKQDDLPEEKRQIYNQMVLEEMDKAHSIINDYLSFAKPQMDPIELVDAKQLIEEALASLKDFAELRNVTVETHLQERLMISANADKFIQSIVHLCKNGIESMPGGGKLQVVAVQQNQTVCIDIIDHGVGMTEDELGRLGTPFYTTRGKGTGLGMMVTYRAIQHIHGRIDVTSKVGKGTCFSILIPSLHSSSYH